MQDGAWAWLTAYKDLLKGQTHGQICYVCTHHVALI